VRRRGFTLLELLLAITIFTMVIGTVYFTLRAGVDSFHHGRESMELYQNVRIGLNRVAKDVRRALSPESPWSNLAEKERQGIVEPVNVNPDDPYYEEEKEENDIIFKGDSRQMTFVVPEFIRDGELPYDLREVRYSVNSEEKMLVRETTRSIIKERMVDWRAFRSENETDYRLSNQMEANFEAFTEEIVDRITDLELRYFNGEEWQDSWDSNDFVEDDSYYSDYADDSDLDGRLEDEEPERVGLPYAVEITFYLENGDTAMLVTEIPAKDVDRMVNEKDDY
jgi:prepilin-type N-terminal cleavage/methylation domain-containing protein